MNKIIATAAAALALCASAAHADTNLVSNGSFEANQLGSGSWTVFANPVGWTTSGGSLELRNNVAGSAQDGNMYAELDGYGNMAISQTLSTVVGQTYTLSFWFSDRTGVAVDSNGISWSVGALSGLVNGPYNGTGNNVWQQFTTTFTATSTSTVLSFAGAGTSDSLGSSLDNISVTAVPEPATFGLMAAGLGLMGVVRRRRAR